jgi:hypothetical protein
MNSPHEKPDHHTDPVRRCRATQHTSTVDAVPLVAEDWNPFAATL